MIINRQIENVLQIWRYNIASYPITSLTIQIRNSLYNSLISNVQIIQDLMYNISPNGEYLGLFKYPSFLEIYKFDGSKYNLHRRKTAINFFNLNPNTFN